MAQKNQVKHKRRYCCTEGCTRIVKSQGLCQRHGAKTRKCKIGGCEKQAQGNFDGMCKLHFKITKSQPNMMLAPEPRRPISTMEREVVIPDAADEIRGVISVYDSILPESIGWTNQHETMPLEKYLQEGFDAQKPMSWHRNEERRSRGLPPISHASAQLEGWERELVWHEILLLSGSPPSAYNHLARSWGRDRGFHMVLSQYIFQQRSGTTVAERQSPVKTELSARKRSRRAPMEMSPSGEDFPTLLQVDDVDPDVDMLGALGVEVDPTTNFTSTHNYPSLAKRSLSRSSPVEMNSMQQLEEQQQEQQHEMHQPLHQHTMQPPQVPYHLSSMYHSPHGQHHMMNQQQQQQLFQQQQQQQQVLPHKFLPYAIAEQQNYVINGGQALAKAMMLGNMLTNDDFICEEITPATQQQNQQQKGAVYSPVPV